MLPLRCLSQDKQRNSLTMQRQHYFLYKYFSRPLQLQYEQLHLLPFYTHHNCLNVQCPFDADIKMMKIMPLQSQCGRVSQMIFAIERKQTGEVQTTINKLDCCQNNSQSFCLTISQGQKEVGQIKGQTNFCNGDRQISNVTFSLTFIHETLLSRCR